MKKVTSSIPITEKCHIHVRHYGDALHHLVCIHGGPGLTLEVFEDFPEMIIVPDLGITCFDLPGSYHSDPIPANQASIELFTDSLSKVIDSMVGKRIHLLGHSMGGAMAMEYAASNQERIESLVLSNWMSNIEAYSGNLKKLFEKLDAPLKQRFREFIENQSYASAEF